MLNLRGKRREQRFFLEILEKTCAFLKTKIILLLSLSLIVDYGIICKVFWFFFVGFYCPGLTWFCC